MSRMDVISRSAAKSAGLKRYYTGVPCVNGHVAERLVKSWTCLECRKEQKATAQSRISKEKREAKAERLAMKTASQKPIVRRVPQQRLPPSIQKVKRAARDMAISSGKKSYFHGVPCSNGHVYEWSTKQNRCLICIRDKVRKWKEKNPAKVTANIGKYRASKSSAMPKWLTSEHIAQIEAVYLQAKIYTVVTGVPYHVDHIIPIRSDLVCGLHVPWNLQVLKGEDNMRKSNKLECA
jgi:hypothetical protein